LLRIDLETVLDRFQFAVSATDILTGCIHGHGDSVIELSDIHTVWWRRSSSQIGVDYLNVPPPDQLDRAEAYWTVRWLLECFPARLFPMGHPYAMRAGENKLAQLRIAPLAGLLPPATIASNEQEKLLKFLDGREDVIVKPLHTPVVPGKDGEDVSLIAISVRSADLRDMISNTQTTFLFLQERVPKIYDVRVNVFPGRAVACRIDPAPGLEEVDWRPVTASCPHSIIDLPARIESSCRAFLELMGLKWGAFDFGVTASGDWIFFECNPNGQWLWIELQTKYKLASIVADELLKHYTGSKCMSK
jgi:glutathione synthase/RimK-type ligase-like ATP-grasp enzyme